MRISRWPPDVLTRITLTFLLYTMNRRITFERALEEALLEEFSRDSGIFSIGEDIRKAGYELATVEFRKKFADRLIITPLVEDMLGSIGLGMAMGGLKPIITFSHETFIGMAFHDIYRLSTWRYRMGETTGPDVVFRVSGGGTGRGSELDTSFVAQLLHLPNLIIAAPSAPYYAKGLLKTALRHNGPVVFFEHKRLYETEGEVPNEEYIVPFGTSEILRGGRDLTIISWSFMAHKSVFAADQLAKNGVRPEVLALQTLHPMDFPSVKQSAEKTGKVIIVEEGMLRGGVGAEIGSRLSEELPHCRIKRVAAKNVPIGSGPFENYIIPNEGDILYACGELINS